MLEHHRIATVIESISFFLPHTTSAGKIYLEKTQPGFNYLKANNGDTRALYEIYSEITIKTPDDLSLLLIIKRFHILFDFEQEIAGWESI